MYSKQWIDIISQPGWTVGVDRNVVVILTRRESVRHLVAYLIGGFGVSLIVGTVDPVRARRIRCRESQRNTWRD